MQTEKISLQSFSLLSVIGKGSYAKVVLVKKIDTKEIFAMKIIKKKSLSRAKQEEHILTERNVLVKVQHPFIIQLFSTFQSELRLFFVLEYCPGGELFFLLKKRKTLTEDQTRFYTAQIILAIEHLHRQNIIYRDLKPENVLIDLRGYIRITDFGLSKQNIVGGQDTYSVCGTPEYIAPEILLKSGHGKPVDWWTVGGIVYEMLTGVPPFFAPTREEIFENIKTKALKYPSTISPAAKNFLEGLLNKNPEKRLGTKGAEQVKDHPWFINVNWSNLLKKKYKPPFIPAIKSDLDLSNFDPEFTELPIETPESSSMSDYSSNHQYSNFTYEAQIK